MQPRSVLVTGGGSGFGLDIARALRDRGDAVCIADADNNAVAAAAEEGLTAVHTDVRDAASLEAAVGISIDRFGGLDAVVASAGVFQMGPLEQISDQEWERVLGVNLTGAFLSARTAAAALRESGRGRIVFIGSDCGRRGFPLQAAYVASKFGLVGLTEALAAELAPSQVTVNCVCPVGCPTTGMGQQVLRDKIRLGGGSADEILAGAARGNPLGRNATESDVTAAVLFLLSDQASFLTGLALDIDGGAHLGRLPGMTA